MEQNLRAVMGGEFATKEEAKSIVRTAWRNFARGIYETVCTLHAPKESLKSIALIEGEEHLNGALAKGKGVIALSAHLGNFSIIGARLTSEGYPFSALVKQPREDRFARLIDDMRTRVGVKTISARPRRKAVNEIIRALRGNEMVLIIADEFKSTGVEVDFFGHPSPVPRGPVTLALRTGAVILPMFMIRDRSDRLTLYIGPELDLVQSGDLQQDVNTNVTLFSRRLEEMVRRYPDQWNWLGFRANGERPNRRVAFAKPKVSDDQPKKTSSSSPNPPF